MASSNKRQFLRYAFYKVDPEWRRLPAEEQAAHKAEFADVVDSFADKLYVLRTYTTVGTRGDVDFLIWSVGAELRHLHDLQAALNRTKLAGYCSTPYSYLAMTKRSIYVREHRHEGQEGTRLTVQPQGATYLFVYPFVKTRQWYALPLEERQRAMNQHIEIGHKYPSVRLNTSYSFGLDDQEFVVAFESDSPADFLDLVMELRESEASSYTLRDTPIFTCVAADIRSALDAVGGA